MTCITPERFVEILETGGPDSAAAPDRLHFQECATCRGTWSELAAAHEVMRETRRPKRQSGFAALAAAAVIVIAVGFALLRKADEPVLHAPAKIQEVDATKVAALIAKLDADTIAERTAAGDELLKLGPAVRKHLEKALESGSDGRKAALRSLLARAPMAWLGAIAFTRELENSNDRMVVAFEDGKFRDIVKGWSPCWAPDGKRLSYVTDKDGNPEIYSCDRDGGNPARLTRNGMEDLMPRWSPDGKRIIYVTNRDGNYEIYVMNSDGTEPKRLTLNDKADYFPDWSPDGKRIVFVSSRDGNDEIYTMDADGKGPVRLTYCPVIDVSPRWSPDGKRILFMSSRGTPEDDGISTNMDLYSMNADGSDPDRLTQERTGEWPAWSPEGLIVYIHENQERTEANPLQYTLAIMDETDRGVLKVGEVAGALEPNGGSMQVMSTMGFRLIQQVGISGGPTVTWKK